MSLALLAAGAAHAFTITLDAASPKILYLQIGVGTFTGTYCGAGCSHNPPIAQSPGSAPGINTKINKVSVSVPASAVGNGTAQAMTTYSTQALSFFDGFARCNTPAQLYIGGFYRTPGNSGVGTSATVTATVPTSLTDAAGDTLAFTLDNLPDSFRYSRAIPAYGVNGGVEQLSANVFATTDVAVHDQPRPTYWDADAAPCPDVTTPNRPASFPPTSSTARTPGMASASRHRAVRAHDSGDSAGR